MSDKNQGIYRKYSVHRLNDREHKHRECEYFVLDWVHDKFAAVAARAYAEACKSEFPALARELRLKAAQAEYLHDIEAAEVEEEGKKP